MTTKRELNGSQTRRFSRRAKWALSILQDLKDVLLLWMPFTPIDREYELLALLHCLSDLQDDILDDVDRDHAQVHAWLLCCAAFPASLDSKAVDE